MTSPAQDSCPDYMIKAEQCLKDEEDRVEGYLHATSKVERGMGERPP